MAIVLRYHDAGMGSFHDGIPARHLTDDDVATLARERGVTVKALLTTLATLKTGDGGPMYTESKAAAHASERATEKATGKPDDTPTRGT